MQPAFQVYGLPASAISDHGFKTIRGRRARGLRLLSVDPTLEKFKDAPQFVYFDVETMLWLRWEMEVDLAPNLQYYGYDFAYEPTLDLHPPRELQAPDCFRGQWLSPTRP
jgi:hypothetical protein